MTIDLHLCQGRLADRKDGTIAGARLTAEALFRRYGMPLTTSGTPAPAVTDDWTESLAQGRATLNALAGNVDASLAAGRFPILVANTCSASLATLPVAARHHPGATLLWIDAHGDFNTPDTTDSGYLGGMVLAAACGLWDSGHGGGIDPLNVVIVGARDIDDGERELLASAGVTVIAPGASFLEEIRNQIGDGPVWVHVDWDVLEPGHIPADYSIPGGLRPDDVRAVFEAIPQGSLKGLEVAEFHAPDPDAFYDAELETILETVGPALEARVAA